MPQGKISRMPIAAGATSAYRRWQLCWGATPSEVAEALAGDDMCPSPRVSFTRAITIAARPEEVWPWLVQVGFGRDGRYSYDPRSTDVTADVTDDGTGDGPVTPTQPADRRPARRSQGAAPVVLRIVSFRRPESLLWETGWGSWVWVLRPVGATATRLITRGRQRQHVDPALPRVVLPTEDADFRLVRRMLTGIKRRSEAWAVECATGPTTVAGADPEAAGAG